MSWQEEWKNNLRTAQDLAQAGLIPSTQVGDYEKLLRRFQFSLPRYYASLIDHSDANCPIRRQAIPSLEELQGYDGLSPDPLQDLVHRPESRITHRYKNRALLHLTSACSLYCRYCFRKTLLGELREEMFDGALEAGFTYLENHPEIEEVILSGGDPLMVSDASLNATLERLAQIGHLKRIRVHTRVPVTFPARVTYELSRALTLREKPVVIVTHFNHPRELTLQSLAAVQDLRKAGAVLNQAVLLAGVNANAACLMLLSEGLFDAGVLPYYLHHPDRAEGTGHFQVSLEEGLKLYEELKAALPGYLVPKYVIDIVGEPYKTSVESYYRRRLL